MEKETAMNTTEIGRAGEAFAEAMLCAQGYQILERNFRCSMGEIDLIAEREGEIAFVEVKTRRSLQFGTPADAVTTKKQSRMRRTAQAYLSRCGKMESSVQFQVVEILYNQIAYAF